MAKLPVESSPTVRAIYQAYEMAHQSRPSRRLGASKIGQECQRRTFYDFRWALSLEREFDGRMLRLFDTGHKAEPRFVDDLRKIGCEVHEIDPSTGEQWTFTALGGHLVAKIDAAVLGLPEAPKTWHVAEFKTHSSKSFSEVSRKGVRVAKPEHYAQMLLGMHLSGMERAFYLAVNKDTDELYSERLTYSKMEGEALLKYAESIIRSSEAPARAFSDPEKYPCKFCPHVGLCWQSVPPQPAVPCKVNCRNCVHATAEINESNAGTWKCDRKKVALSEQDQVAACEDHLFLPSFVSFADVVSADLEANEITYKKRNDTYFVNGKDPKRGAYKSVELTVLPHPMIAADQLLDAARAALDGTVVEVE